MTDILRTSDWLRADPDGLLTDPTDGRAQLAGTLAVLSASLEPKDTLERPSSFLYRSIGESIADLPPQAVARPANDEVTQWLNVIALAELLPAPTLARLMVDRVILTLRQSEREEVDGPSQLEHRERLALCWARRGRIMRVVGNLSDAAESYDAALRVAPAKPWRDARPHAMLGHAATALGRGNVPDAERCLDVVLHHAAQVLPFYRIQAHQLYVIAKRRRGLALDALLHGWAAFDLLEPDDSRRAELVVALAEVAADYGDLRAAREGFEKVARLSLPQRIRIPALAGLLKVCVRLAQAGSSLDNTIQWAVHATRDALGDNTAPYDRILALRSLAEVSLFESNDQAEYLSRAKEALVEALRLAELHGFHEQVHAVQERLQATADIPTRQASNDGKHSRRLRDAAPAESIAPDTHPALARFRSLASSASGSGSARLF